MHAPQRELWKGDPERLPDGFTLTKTEGERTMTATCEVWTNPFGWELRLTKDGQSLPIETIVRSADEMRALVERWRTVLLETGWS
jgi:hypothetical protein